MHPSPSPFTYRPHLPRHIRLIIRRVVDHPSFSEHIALFLDATDFDYFSAPLRPAEFNRPIRAAARATRNKLLASPGAGPDARASARSSVARAVWHNDASL
eukprot:7170916-Pyramimonas_sp.AAC.1